MTLLYSKVTGEITDIIERLRSLSLAFKIDNEVKSDDLPSIVDGKMCYEGVIAMNEYIDQLERESGEWYYCSC